jgi:hypothetical protein
MGIDRRLVKGGSSCLGCTRHRSFGQKTRLGVPSRVSSPLHTKVQEEKSWSGQHEKVGVRVDPTVARSGVGKSLRLRACRVCLRTLSRRFKRCLTEVRERVVKVKVAGQVVKAQPSGCLSDDSGAVSAVFARSLAPFVALVCMHGSLNHVIQVNAHAGTHAAWICTFSLTSFSTGSVRTRCMRSAAWHDRRSGR